MENSVSLFDSFTQEEKKAEIRKLINAEAPDARLNVFIMEAQHLGLDPLKKQIYLIKRGKDFVTQVSIGGLRLVAERTQRYIGVVKEEFLDAEGTWHECWVEPGLPIAARASVGVLDARGNERLVIGIAYNDEYNPGVALWQSKPRVMLMKCAEAIALRRAFPGQLSSTYIREEMYDPEPTVARKSMTRPPEPKPEPAATDEQIAAIKDLIADENLPADVADKAREWLESEIEITKSSARKAIERLENSILTNHDPLGRDGSNHNQEIHA